MNIENEDLDISASIDNRVCIASNDSSENRMRNLALLVRETRKNLGLTQREFAKKIGITQATLCKLEKGVPDLKPTKRIVMALFNYVDIDIAQMAAYTSYSVEELMEYETFTQNDGNSVVNELQDLSSEQLSLFSGISKYLKDPENVKALQSLFRVFQDIDEGPDNQSYAEAIFKRRLFSSNI